MCHNIKYTITNITENRQPCDANSCFHPLETKQRSFPFFPPIVREKNAFFLFPAHFLRKNPLFTCFSTHTENKTTFYFFSRPLQRKTSTFITFEPHTENKTTFYFSLAAEHNSTIAKTNFAARRRSVAESCELWGGELLWAWRRIVVALRRRVPFTLLSLAVALHGKTNFARGGGASRSRANCCAWGGKLLCALWAWRRIVFALRRRVPFTFLVAHPRSRTPSCSRANFAAHGAVSCCAHCGPGGAS